MDIGEEKNVNEAKAEAGRAEADRRVIWQTLLGERKGRDFLWWMLASANIYSSTFRGSDTHASAFAEGARALMIPIQVEIIRANPGAYTLMVTENATKEMVERMKDEQSRNS